MEGKQLNIINIYKYIQETNRVCPRPLNTYMHARKTAQYLCKPEIVNYRNGLDCLNRRKLNMHFPKTLLSVHQLLSKSGD